MLDLDSIPEMFANLEGCLATTSDVARFGDRDDRSVWTFMHTGAPKDVGIRVRQVGRTPQTGRDRKEYMRQRRAAAFAVPRELRGGRNREQWLSHFYEEAQCK